MHINKINRYNQLQNKRKQKTNNKRNEGSKMARTPKGNLRGHQ